MQEYTDITKEYLENRKSSLKKVEKFVFLGTLLGRHIPRIAEKIDANSFKMQLGYNNVRPKTFDKNETAIFTRVK